MDRGSLRRGQQRHRDRQGAILSERGRLPDAHQEGPGAAGPATFQANPEVRAVWARPRWLVGLAPRRGREAAAVASASNERSVLLARRKAPDDRRPFLDFA